MGADEQKDDGGKGAKPKPSWGNVGEHHWSVARRDSNQEAIEYYRERSRAPGVAEGGRERNHYCMSCNGVVPLAYDQRRPADEAPTRCPHCGAELDARVRAMFNWVEIDQPPPSDAPLVGLVLLALAAVALAGLALWWLL